MKRLADEFLFALSMALFVLWFVSGCGTTQTLASIERKPGGAMVDKSPRPCLTTLPTRAVIKSLHEPERASYLDDNGEARSAIRFTVDSESMSAFFNYIESLEKIANKALGCVTR